MENGADHVLILGDRKKIGVKFDYLQSYYDTALERFALKHKDKSHDLKSLLRALLTSDTMMSLLVEIAQLKVFSNEIHEEFKHKLTELGALKQLKYFYAIPLGQLISALTQLHVDMPTSQWWENICKKVHDSDYCCLKTSEFLEGEGKISLILSGRCNTFLEVPLVGVCPKNYVSIGIDPVIGSAY